MSQTNLGASWTPGLVSVVVPTFNRMEMLGNAIRSVVAQTYRPIELIVVDDGSTDDTEAVVREWARKCRAGEGISVRYVRQKNRGAPAARNAGERRARGEFLQFLDSDDGLRPRKFEIEVAQHREGGPFDAVVSQVDYFFRSEGPVHTTHIFPSDPDAPLPELLLESDLPIQAPLHRRAKIRELGGFDERLRSGQEVDLHLRLALAGARFRFIPDVLSYVRFTKDPERITARSRGLPPEVKQGFYRNIAAFGEAHGRLTPSFRRALAERLCREGRAHYARLESVHGRACLETAYELAPEFRTFEASVYLSPFGDVLGVIYELTARALRAGRRRLLHGIAAVLSHRRSPRPAGVAGLSAAAKLSSERLP